jgi:hypothetical protein
MMYRLGVVKILALVLFFIILPTSTSLSMPLADVPPRESSLAAEALIWPLRVLLMF